MKNKIVSFKVFSLFLSEMGIINEAVYKGNIGIMELMQFFAKAKENDPDLIVKVKEHLAKNENDAVWKIVQTYLGVQLHGKPKIK